MRVAGHDFGLHALTEMSATTGAQILGSYDFVVAPLSNQEAIENLSANNPIEPRAHLGAARISA
jgi:hypothetical protein